jgi:ribonuclease BN (tRNA processing enzyme)
VTACALNHPQGCLAFRVEAGGSSVVYATDTEHMAPGVVDPGALALARGADLLIHDAQYTEEEYAGGPAGPPRKGWGHSTVAEACRLASAAEVKRLALFHHDPTHDDRFVERTVCEARALFPNVAAAREGMTVTV